MKVCNTYLYDQFIIIIVALYLYNDIAMTRHHNGIVDIVMNSTYFIHFIFEIFSSIFPNKTTNGRRIKNNIIIGMNSEENWSVWKRMTMGFDETISIINTIIYDTYKTITYNFRMAVRKNEAIRTLDHNGIDFPKRGKRGGGVRLYYMLYISPIKTVRRRLFPVFQVSALNGLFMYVMLVSTSL